MKATPALAAALFLLAACDPGPRTGDIVTSAPSTEASGFGPRSDGLYVGEPDDNNRTFLRFYDDHAVVEAGVALSATPDDVRRWLTKTSDKEVSRGTWSPGGTFTVTSAQGDVGYTVTGRRAGGYTLTSHSKINGHDGALIVTFSPDTP